MTRKLAASVPEVLAVLEDWRCHVEFRRDVWCECLVSNEDERYVGVGHDDPEALAEALSRMFPSRVAWSLLEQAVARRPRPDGGSRAESVKEPGPSGAERHTGPAPDVSEGGGAPSSRSVTARLPSGSDTVVRRRPSQAGTAEVAASSRTAQEAGPALLESSPSVPLVEVPASSRLVPSRREVVVVAEPGRSFIAPELVSRAPASSPGSGAPTSSPHATAPGSTPNAAAQVSGAPRATALFMDPPDSAESALADVISLEHHALAIMPELALMAPRLLRLHLMGWAARARSYEEEYPGDHRLHQAVTEFFGKLGRTSKQYWPGNVRALSAEASPAECLADLDTRTHPDTWREIADLSAQTIENLHARAGVDEYGWSDGERLDPPPVDPQKLLAECIAVTRTLQQRTQADERLPQELADEVQKTARRLRWLRGSTPDEVAWGQAMGTLRQLSQKQPHVARLVREILEPSYCPSEPWAKLLGHDPEKRRRQRLRKEILQTIPRAGASEPEVMEWIVKAINAELTNPELARHLAPHRELVLGLDPASLAAQDRRVRSRMTKLHRILKGESPGGAAGEEREEEGTEPEPEVQAPARAREFDLAAGFTRGKHALFVSNRDDPELKEQLEKTFQMELTWCVAEPRRIQAVAQAIRSSTYDFVLSATGFQSHKVDRVLADAAQLAGVRFFRVDRGRPLACARAIVRDLGLATRAA